ncbi:MAG: SAM-dependent methyltransferase [Verrucomicrobiota bacterium]
MANPPPPSSPLDTVLRDAITDSPRGLHWASFLELALYHGEHGYYRRPRPIGKRGDFFTSVSVGRCFGLLLARHLRRRWEQWGKPTPFHIVEQGAHHGALALDILEEWPEAPYSIIEPSHLLQKAQTQAFREAGKQSSLSHYTSPSDLPSDRATLFLANELIDAFPVHRLTMTEQGWLERYITLREDAFVEELASPSSPLPPWLPEHLPPGFVLEWSPAVDDWFAALSRALSAPSSLLLIDYGLTREERFTAGRKEGTLRGYRQHQLTDRFFDHLGDTDLTWHIDFTQLADLCHSHGWTMAEFTTQGQFLTKVATPWLQSLEGQADHPLIPQFQTLIHPGMMGKAFQVMQMDR